MQVDAKIFGGLPVVVDCTLQSAQPDVGIPDHVEIDAIYTARVRKRDRKLILNPIPRSWWQRLRQTGELYDLADMIAAEC